jgi:hypothetical protein
MEEEIMPSKPIPQLRPGEILSPTRAINPAMVSNWVYAKECADIRGGMVPGAELRIVETCVTPGKMWVRVEIVGRQPAAFLKIAGENLSNNFDLKG